MFAVKYTPPGNIDRFKARLVARGFSQAPGVDHSDTFSPTLRIESLRTLLALAAGNDLEIHQLDIVSAYLAGKLEETIYMAPPEALGLPKTKALRLVSSLYGLKQSGRVWYKTISVTLTGHGLGRTNSDWSLFVTDDKALIVGLYVDDMVVVGRDLVRIKALKEALTKAYALKDLGEISVCLGIRVTRNRALHTLELDQEQYILGMLSTYGLADCSPVTTPADGYNGLEKALEDELRADQLLYQRVIGSLMHAMRFTRPDIAFAVSKLSQYASDPTVRHPGL